MFNSSLVDKSNTFELYTIDKLIEHYCCAHEKKCNFRKKIFKGFRKAFRVRIVACENKCGAILRLVIARGYLCLPNRLSAM